MMYNSNILFAKLNKRLTTCVEYSTVNGIVRKA